MCLIYRYKEILLLFLIIVVCRLLVVQFFYFKNITSGNGYNNPLLVMNAIIVFLAFKQVTITSDIINKVAASSFAVYLIHDSDFGHYCISKGIYILNEEVNQPLIYLITLIIISVLVYYICTIVDKILARIYVPITQSITNVLKLYITKR